MKRAFFYASLVFLMESQGLSAQGTPSVKVPYKLNCALLLDQSWYSPDAQVTALCNEAQIACVRYGLLNQFVKSGKSDSLTKRDLSFVKNDTQLKLRGCAIAIDAVTTKGQSLLDAAGFGS